MAFLLDPRKEPETQEPPNKRRKKQKKAKGEKGQSDGEELRLYAEHLEAEERQPRHHRMANEVRCMCDVGSSMG